MMVSINTMIIAHCGIAINSGIPAADPTIKRPSSSVYAARAEKRARKKLVDDLLLTSETASVNEEEEDQAQDPPPQPPVCCAASIELNHAKEKIQALESQINALTLYNQELLKRLQKQDTLSEGKFLMDVKELLKTVLSANQIDLALGIKKRVNWSDKDLSRAFGLRCVKN